MVILYSKTGLNVRFMNFWYTNKSDSDLVWRMQLIMPILSRIYFYKPENERLKQVFGYKITF